MVKVYPPEVFDLVFGLLTEAQSTLYINWTVWHGIFFLDRFF